MALSINALRGFEGLCWQFDAGFSPASIFHIWQSPFWQILIPNTLFFSLPKIGANSLQTALPCNYSTCSTKRHTGANQVVLAAVLPLLMQPAKSYVFSILFTLFPKIHFSP
ncbi:MAG: hypothetical protein ACLVEN_02795 [Anaerotignum lactatifermentans]|uniref:hypothetical protein n=1 Tax=Anaerotignum lactatifermentans TaxID=160404 RepID=UPI00399A1511